MKKKSTVQLAVEIASRETTESIGKSREVASLRARFANLLRQAEQHADDDKIKPAKILFRQAESLGAQLYNAMKRWERETHRSVDWREYSVLAERAQNLGTLLYGLSRPKKKRMVPLPGVR